MNSSKAVFLEGSILRHILVMSATSTLGLFSLFFVDLLDLYFLSLLGDTKIVAGVGFSATLLFLLFSMCIGVQICMGALVARAEGQRQRQLAGRYCTNVWIVSFSLLSVFALLLGSFLTEMLIFIGAEGATLDYALRYSYIMLPSLLLVVLSMSGAAALRAIGDAKRSMYSTLLGGGVNAVLDPLFIFGFGWGVEGAAFASVISRLSMFSLVMYALFIHHKLPRRTRFHELISDLPAIMRITLPALVTNLMTPIGGTIILKLVAIYGASAVAAYAVLGRIIPVAFGALFSLSGAIGPVVGQNAAAKQYDRVRHALMVSMWVSFLYVMFMWVVLFLLCDFIISTFNIHDQGVIVFKTYTTYLVGLFSFAALLFIANATFNNLNKPHWSMLFNIARTFLGTVPLAYLFSEYYGLKGLMIGDVAGVVLFGCGAFFLALRLINHLHATDKHTVNVS